MSVDAGAIVTRGLGALPRGALNPLLALVPLFDAGPGIVSPRAELLGTADPKARRQFGGPNHSVLIRQSD